MRKVILPLQPGVHSISDMVESLSGAKFPCAVLLEAGENEDFPHGPSQDRRRNHLPRGCLPDEKAADGFTGDPSQFRHPVPFRV